ncbi:MAG: dihydroneopterin aldolase [Kiloniellales bacterium]|nr:dihydroneopterin aldolase [Kiloniellales bacterium]
MTQDKLLSARFYVPNSVDEREDLDRILIRDLVITASIGVHAHEHLAPQRVRINVDLRVRTRSGEAGDEIGNVISYEDLVGGIRKLVAGGHINLVESLAEEIARLCLSDPRAESVTVRVEKPDIEPDAAGVGVEIKRRRPPSPPAAIYRLPTGGSRKAAKSGSDS